MNGLGSGGHAVASPTDTVLGAWPITRAAGRLSNGRLRILAYHDISDPAVFAEHVRYLAEEWSPVSANEVSAYLDGQTELPDRAVWVTFDDGRPAVIDEGLPALDNHDVPATLYVCPAVIDTDEAFWFDALDARPDVQFSIDGRSLAGRALVRALKSVPDHVRRSVVAQVTASPSTLPLPTTLTRAHLRTWIDSGREIGNHTWDHPILDQCSPAEQVDQVKRAHEWLSDALGITPQYFAYPNGDRTEVVASELSRLDYKSAPLFDHRLTTPGQDRFGLSRIRIDAHAPLSRLRALMSGAHTGLLNLKQQVRSRASES